MIDVNKKYRTRDGRPVRLLCKDRKNRYNDLVIVGLVMEETQDHEFLTVWDSNGRNSPSGSEPNRLDLIEILPYQDFALDALVKVYGPRQGDFSRAWHLRHFAGVSEDGYPLTWPDGKTSLTWGGTPEEWEVAELVALTPGNEEHRKRYMHRK